MRPLARRVLRSTPRRPTRPDVATEYASVAAVLRHGAAPLRPQAPPAEGPLDVAVIVPPFREGSGGHRTISHLVRGLEQRGHRCAFFIHDPLGRSGRRSAERFREEFGPFAALVRNGLDGFTGADVALATGWQTVHAVLRLEGCGARAYLVQDHEPEFHPTSAERTWAEDSYRHGLHCITAGTWLADLVAARYDAAATAFDLGVDHATYAPQGLPRAERSILYYARAATPRRAVALGLLGLAELKRRRPEVDIALFGDAERQAAPFPHRHVGVATDAELAALYAQHTVGLVLSMTNYSLVPQEMLACGMACVELDTPSTRRAFGDDRALELAAFSPDAVADALERLIADGGHRAEMVSRGTALVAGRTWPQAAAQVEAGLYAAVATARQ